MRNLKIQVSFLISVIVIFMGSSFAQVCSNPGHDGPTYSSNGYFPGIGSAASGQKIVTVGSARTDTNASTTPLAAGDQVFLIQMQDAIINNANSIAYGDNSTGRGSTDIRNSGRYEFAIIASVATATNTTLTLRDNLANSYNTAVATTTLTRRSFQVIRVPQLSNTTLALNATLNTTPWDGFTGGVFVMDVAGNLDLNGATINASAVGFRGGGGKQGSVIIPGGTDYATASAATASNLGAVKGEGIAGTPKVIRSTGNAPYNGILSVLTGGDLGYPNSLDQSRGAPGNAGGGGTSHNAGGGGGSNAGSGGKGGYSYARYSLTSTGTASCTTAYRTLTSGTTTYYACDGDQARDVGGLPGKELTPNAIRLLSGGGGGAGDSNNSADFNTTIQNSGGTGGGVIFIRAATITGSGNLLANGQDGLPGGRDGAGGGGAGGTIAIASGSTALSGVVARANGGAGGRSGLPLTGNETQGSGGGGGGGAIIKPTAMTLSASSQTLGGVAGVNVPANVGAVPITNTYGSTSAVGGVADLIFDNVGIQPPGTCVANVSITKATTTPTRVQGVDLTATYTITIANTGNALAQAVSIQDALPTPFTYASTGTITATGITRFSTTDPTVGNTNPLWSAWDVPAGTTLTLQFAANLNVSSLNTPSPVVYQNSATVTYSDPLRTIPTAILSSTYNGNLPANTADNVTVTPSADLSITKADGITNIQGLALTTYTVTLKNNGPSDVVNAAFKDPIATNMVKTAVNCTSVSGCPAAPGVTLAALEGSTGILVNLTNGQILTFTVTVALTTPTVGTNVTNTATTATPNGTTDPILVGATSQNTASDTNTINLIPPTVSGNVYWDKDHSSNLSANDTGISGVTITLTPNAGPVITIITDINGAYIANVSPNMLYQILETDLTGYISTTTNTLNISVILANIVQQNFFDYRGSKISGTVFRDDGYGNLGTLTANDALQNNLEPGLANITVSVLNGLSLIDSALTDTNGNYLVWIPFGTPSSLNLTQSLFQSVATGNNIAGVSIYKASSVSDSNASSIPVAFVSGQSLTSYNFAQVPVSSFQPDRSGSAISPGSVNYTHLYRPGTLGVVVLSRTSSAGYNAQYFLDSNCDGAVSAAEHTSSITGFNVDQNWLREPNGTLKSCALEILLTVPAGRPPTETDITIFKNQLAWANSVVIETRNVKDTTYLISSGGELKLTKTIRNVTQGTSATTTNGGKPGETLEYCITYTNVGQVAVSNVIVSDPVPFFTTFLPGSITLNAATLTDGLDGDAGEIILNIITVRVGTVAPGASGIVCYRVNIQ